MTTNWDRYLKGALKEEDLRQRVDRAGLAWDIALQISALREQRGLTQAQLAERMGTRQANVSRLESGDYRGYTLQTLDRVARALGARLEVILAASPSNAIGQGEPLQTTRDSQASSGARPSEVRPTAGTRRSQVSNGDRPVGPSRRHRAGQRSANEP